MCNLLKRTKLIDFLREEGGLKGIKLYKLFEFCKVMLEKKTLKKETDALRMKSLRITSLRGVEWVYGLFLFPLVLGKM